MNWQVFINSFYQGYGRRQVFFPFYISKADFILLFAHVRNKDLFFKNSLVTAGKANSVFETWIHYYWKFKFHVNIKTMIKDFDPQSQLLQNCFIYPIFFLIHVSAKELIEMSSTEIV